MRIIIGAPGNGAVLKEALKEKLAGDERVSALVDLSTPDITYPEISFQAGQAIAEGRADRGILVCGTGIGTAIAANKVAGIRAATAHDLTSVRGAVENYNAQILCMGQNVIAAPAAWALVDIWLNLRHDAHSSYAPKVHEISAFEQQKKAVQMLFRLPQHPRQPETYSFLSTQNPIARTASQSKKCPGSVLRPSAMS